ncbi:unnamed protein product [Allacma fusca]|uniref:G-protein coupled receptors family 3 profile domain-containing protein n=1 Tax=Allacma fusca TaxID=39272 RepID=A0A8J2JMD6_9HEXA|nr:unnamed protein product [Allacma fusca]
MKCSLIINPFTGKCSLVISLFAVLFWLSFLILLPESNLVPPPVTQYSRLFQPQKINQDYRTYSVRDLHTNYSDNENYSQVPTSHISLNSSSSSSTWKGGVSSVVEKVSDNFNISGTHKLRRSSRERRKKLAILGLFELSETLKMTNKTITRPSGYSELLAAELALEDINRLNVVEGYELVMYTNDTKCNPGVGMDAFYHAIYSRKDVRTIALLGTACSEVTELLAKIVQYKNMVQVSFGSISPSLSDRAEFPYFYRTVAPVTTHDSAIIELIRLFRWDTVTFFTKNENKYTMPANHLVRALENANISCKAALTFSHSDVGEQLDQMKELDSRIIIASFGADIAPFIFCKVYEMKMFGSDYVWILIGQTETTLWENEETMEPISTRDNRHLQFSNHSSIRFPSSRVTSPPLRSSTPSHNCSQWQLIMAVEHSLIVDRHNFIQTTKAADFRKRLRKILMREKHFYEESPFAPEVYDAMWSVALGLKGFRDQYDYPFEDVSYEGEDFAKNLTEVMKSLSFNGISGPISFSGPDRVGITSISQIQGGKRRPVGLFSPLDSILNLTCSGCWKIVWHKNQVPIARRVFRVKIIRVESSPYIIVAALAFLGIVMAVTFLAFNLYHRKLKYIKLSSPRLNNMVIIGCIFAYVAVILLGSDFGPEPDGKHFAYICTVRAYLLSTGFSLAFGAMFAKTYRVHRIFTRSCLGVVKNKLLRDTQLMTVVMTLLVIDCIIVSSWAIFDPMHRKLQNLTIEDDPHDRSVVYQPKIEVCTSQHGHVWLSVLYGYKSLLLVVGVYMAWETRHVKIQALNDSNYIGLCVYVVVLTSVLGVTLANLVSDKVTLSFISVTALILISTTVTLCLLFLPKIHVIVTAPAGVDPVVESMGLKIEFNTRRFMYEDTKESLFRAEVQNRVYKRQIDSIDAELRRIENLITTSETEAQMQECLKEGETRTPIVQVTMDACSSLSSEETESQSEIYTIYLHGPRFIIPISLFNFNPNSTLSTVAAAASEARAVAKAVGISNTARSSWPNTRNSLSPNGLTGTKYCFKSEPRLLTEESDIGSMGNSYNCSSKMENGGTGSRDDHSKNCERTQGDDFKSHHHILFREGSEESQSLSSSVPDLWAVRNSTNLGPRKKFSVYSAPVTDKNAIFSVDSISTSLVDPVLKLIATSDESPYL